jgi:hypothetical protein
LPNIIVCSVRFNSKLFFVLLFALLAATRLCHLGILWAEENLPMAAAQQMVDGKTLYRDAWFDKPPLIAAFYAPLGARPGWPLRLTGALYALLVCWIAYRFARDLWSPIEGAWAGALAGFFLIFDLPSAVIPVASDLLMLAPHLAAVWLAWKRKPFWSGALAAVAFWVSPKGVFVAAACALWNPAGLPLLAAGFASVSAAAAAWLWAAGALPAYWEQVWRWGLLYAGAPLTAHPLRDGLVRSANWAGFHLALVVGALVFLWRARKAQKARWIAWCALAVIGVTAGLRFFPRYYFLLLAPVVLMASRGFTLLVPCPPERWPPQSGSRPGKVAVHRSWRGLVQAVTGRGNWRALATLLLLIPAIRFGPRYARLAIGNSDWTDTLMDRDSRQVAALIRKVASKGDTLFVWGYRPELYIYTRIPAANRFLDCQPLTGVPADRHLTDATPLESEAAAARRVELAQAYPTFVADGLSVYNPRLELTRYPELRTWFARYREVARTAYTIIYRRE